MADRRQKVWVRQTSFSASFPATTVEGASVVSMRGASTVTTGTGAVVTGLPNEFTVVRLIGHWTVEHFAATAAAGTTNNPPVVFGFRVAGAEEIEEMIADIGFRSESGPSSDPMADWMAWVPGYADNPSGFDANASEITVGKGMFDLRAARRVDGLREDIAVMMQATGTVPTGMITSARLSWSALCLV